jgi:hypothetical protein
MSLLRKAFSLRQSCVAALLTAAGGCGGSQPAPGGERPASGSAVAPASASVSASRQADASQFVEGQDYVVVERRVFLDEARFDRPVEAFSLLFPRGWNIQGGVRWKGLGNCRADIVSNEVTATSADGTIRYQVLPSRSFVFTDDPMMRQVYQAGAQGGGCEVNAPFDASQYIAGYAQRDLQATASDMRVDEERMAISRQLDARSMAAAQQFGNQMQQKTTYAFGKITWPNGDEGLMHVGVTTMVLRKPNMVTGGVSTDSSTSVFYAVLMRYPAARRDEGTKLFGTIQSSFRQNPIWKQAKETFLTQVGNVEHAGRLDAIRLMGEQASAYAKSASEAQDRQMRSWEKQQASQEGQHKAFVQTIREVDTWRDSTGTVELSSGYSQAWSRGDGSYILSNKPTFDPSSAFQDQRWTEMKREKPGGS